MKKFALLLPLLLLPLLVHAASSARITPVVRAVAQVAPSVVNITSSRTGISSPVEQFFAMGLDLPRRKRSSLGSGVIVDGKRGLILTNAHVIAPGDEIRIHLQDGREFAAKILGLDADFDIAVLQTDAPSLPSVPMGDASDLMPGESVIAIGNPYGFGHTVTTGVVSATNRSIRNEHGMMTDLIQTDAAINPGNSGGPLLNIEGALIGINTAIDARAEGIGFAIPINKARMVMDGLMHKGRMEPLWLGIMAQNVDQRIARAMGLHQAAGVLVTQVFENTPAARKGLRPGDVISRINGTPLRDKRDYVNILRNQTKGASLTLQGARDGKSLELSLTPEAFSDGRTSQLLEQVWGFTARELKERVIVAAVDPHGPSPFLRKGDVLRSVANEPIRSLADLYNAFRRERMANQVIIIVERNGRSYYGRITP